MGDDGPFKLKTPKIVHETNEAATLVKTELGAKTDLIPVQLTLGIGGMKVNYAENTQWVICPAVMGEHQLGDFSLYWQYAYGLFGKTKFDLETDLFIGSKETGKLKTFSSERPTDLDQYHAANVGLTYSLTLDPNMKLIFLGSIGGIARVQDSNLIGSNIESDLGLSIDFGSITLYNLTYLMFSNQKDYAQYWTNIWPQFQGNIVGAYFKIGETGISAEWTYDKFFNEVAVGADLPLLGGIGLEVFGRKEEVIRDSWAFGFWLTLNLDSEPEEPEVSSRWEFSDSKRTTKKYETAQSATEISLALLVQAPVYLLEDTDAALEAQENARKNILDNYETDSMVEEDGSIDGYLARMEKENPNTTPVKLKILEAMGKANSFDEFINNYMQSAGTFEEKILVAATLAGLGNIYYDENLADASRFGEQWKEWSEMDANDVYTQMMKSLKSGEKLGAGVCAHINELAAEFLRRTGVKAYGVSVPAGGGRHLIAVAVNEETNMAYAINYGIVHAAKGDVLDALRIYARFEGITIHSIYLFGSGGSYQGFYVTPEGRVINEAIYPGGVDMQESAKERLKRVPKKAD